MNYVKLAVGAIVVAVLLWLGLIVKGWRHDSVVELPRALASIDQLQEAGKGKDDTITSLQKSVAEWKKLATEAPDLTGEIERLKDEARRRAAQLDALKRSEEKDREKPDCAALLAMDIAAACPAIAAGVRDRARGGVPRPAGGSAGASGSETPR